jgi:hypothetical protein
LDSSFRVPPVFVVVVVVDRVAVGDDAVGLAEVETDGEDVVKEEGVKAVGSAVVVVDGGALEGSVVG